MVETDVTEGYGGVLVAFGTDRQLDGPFLTLR